MADEVAETIANFERLAIETGEWRGTVVEFSNDNETWHSHIFPTEDAPFPRLARATVHRKGVKIPTVVVISWDESIPDADTDDGIFWRHRWEKSPHPLFGSAAVRAALRRAFRDVIGEIRVLEERTWAEPPTREPAAPATPATPAEDWAALILDAGTAEEVQTVMQWAKEAGELTDAVRLPGLTRIGMLARQERKPA